MRTRVPAILAMLLAVAPATPSLAAWPNSPIVNVPLCTASFDQFQPKGVSDGAGGAIVTWSDYRSGLLDVYAQHVLASGAVNPAWPAGGRALCTALSNQFNPMIVSDGAGGAIVTWNDSRNGLLDIYAQRVLASGAVDPAWPADGRAVCTAVNSQGSPKLVSDGVGGAIVAWHDLRGGSTYDIYAQHVLASGVADPAWPTDGRLLCNSAGDQKDPTIVSDGVGGAIIAWGDMRNGADSDIYVQHVRASGAIDLAWPSGGQALSTAPGHQARPALATDGDGGAIVTWHDLRSFTSYDIYAQHVLAFGMVPAGWPLGGLALCTAANEQSDPTIASDGAGGAIVCWNDYRNGAFSEIYAQRVLASGAVDPVWPANGQALCTTPSNRSNPTIVLDGAGGAIVAWQDFRSGTSYDTYAQRVLTSGGIDYSWPIDGRAISTAALDQLQPILLSDGAAGAIVV